MLQIKQDFAEPSAMFREMIKVLVPKDILSTDGLSVSGWRDTVKLPPVLIRAVNGKQYSRRSFSFFKFNKIASKTQAFAFFSAYVRANSAGCPYDSADVLRNMLDKMQRRVLKVVGSATGG